MFRGWVSVPYPSLPTCKPQMCETKLSRLTVRAESMSALQLKGWLTLDKSGRFNGSTQHQLEGVYLQEVQTPKSFASVDLNAALPCSVLIESSRAGRLPGGSIACYF